MSVTKTTTIGFLKELVTTRNTSHCSARDTLVPHIILSTVRISFTSLTSDVCVVKPFHVRVPVSTCSIDEICCPFFPCLDVAAEDDERLGPNHLVEPRFGSRSEAVASTPRRRARASTCINSVSLAVGFRALTCLVVDIFVASCLPTCTDIDLDFFCHTDATSSQSSGIPHHAGRK